MNPALCDYTIAELRKLDVHEADRRLCAMPSWQLCALGDRLGLRLPAIGGDKPAVIGVALRAKPVTP